MINFYTNSYNLEKQHLDEDHPNLIIFATKIGNAYFSIKDYHSAQTYFEEAIKRDPNFKYAHLSLAKTHFKMGNE